MGNMIKRLVVNALALWLTVLLAQWAEFDISLAPGVNGAIAAVVTVIALALVNATIGKVIKLLTLPLTLLSLGLWTFVINALMFLLVGRLTIGFSVGNFWAGLFGSVVYSILSVIISSMFGDEDKSKE